MNERQNKILELLLKEGKVEVVQLSHMLGVSQVTIRKDLNNLEEKGIIKDIIIASDSLDPESIETAANILKGASLDIIPQYDTNNIIIKNIVEIIF